MRPTLFDAVIVWAGIVGGAIGLWILGHACYQQAKNDWKHNGKDD